MLEALADLSSPLLKKNLILVLLPGLIVPLFIQFPEWTTILGSLAGPTSPAVFGFRLLWDIVVIGTLSWLAFEILVTFYGVLRLLDDYLKKSGAKWISGGVLLGAIGVLFLYMYQINVGKEHLVVPPWIYTYVSAVLIVLQAGSIYE